MNSVQQLVLGPHMLVNTLISMPNNKIGGKEEN